VAAYKLNKLILTKAGLKALIITGIVFMFFLIPRFSYAMNDKKAPHAKRYSLSEITVMANKYNVSIIDWQHDDYSLLLDKEKIKNQTDLVEWLKKNLHNWGLVDEKQGIVRFYLLPVGVDAATFTNVSAGDGEPMPDAAFSDLRRLSLSATHSEVKRVFDLEPVKQLAALAAKERDKKLFFHRKVTVGGSGANDYSFSASYREKLNKFLPYQKNGQPIAGKKMEGFVSYDTALKFLQSNESKLRVGNAGKWTFFNIDGAANSYMAIKHGEDGIVVAASCAPNGKKIIDYYIQGKGQGFKGVIHIPTRHGEMVLEDAVTYF
jgi:hypothetical protein